MLAAAFAGSCVDPGCADRFEAFPTHCLEGESLYFCEYLIFMIESRYYIYKVFGLLIGLSIIQTQSKVLSSNVHVLKSIDPGSFVNDKASSTRMAGMAFKATYQHVFVVRNINGFEIPWYFQLGKIVIINQFYFRKFTQMLLITIRLQLLRIKDYKRHREV